MYAGLFGALILLTCLFSAPPAGAQDYLSTIEYKQQYIIQKINGEIILDGFSTEPVWDTVETLPVVQHEPNFGSKPSEEMELRIAYDEQYVYVSGRLYDREPHKIASASKERDSSNPNCQWFGIALDTFNDNENAMAFFTTPSGLRWDALINNDTQGNINYNSTWNTFWDVEVARNEEGWFAEFRIPFSSLRFQDVDGEVIMGLISWRMIPRRTEKDIFPAIPPNWSSGSYYKISEAQDIVFKGITNRKPVYVVPYLLSGLNRLHPLSENNEYARKKDSTIEAGLDLKYAITNNLILDVTYNTDFAQVEADDQQINLSRFSLFFPEKRLFFQERSNAFDFNFEDSDRLFHSRKIGLNDGKPVKILGGARLVGRIGSWDVGMVNLQTDKSGNLPSQNMGALRLRRQVINPSSYIGLMNTTRIGDDGSENMAYGLDGIFNLFGDDYLAVKWAQTFDSADKNSVLSLDPARYFVDWERRTVKGIGYKVGVSYSGSDYDPVLGFQNRSDYTLITSRLLYGWFPGKQSRWFRKKLSYDGNVYFNNGTGDPETVNVYATWDIRSKSGYIFKITPGFRFERIPEDFTISGDLDILKGDYRFGNINASLHTPYADIMHTFTADVGEFFDGVMVSTKYVSTMNLSPSVEIESSYKFSHIDFSDRNQHFNNHIARLRLLYMYDTKISFSSFVQYNNAVDIVSANSRFRYNPREGIDLYLVYNETFNTDRNGYIPVRPFSRDRRIMFKYMYTLSY